jgi:hypothetical protein
MSALLAGTHPSRQSGAVGQARNATREPALGDRSFVVALDQPGGWAIVRAILELGHALSRSVVAEGVEDAETCAALEVLGCDLIQGYHIGRPVPAAELAPWIAPPTVGSPVLQEYPLVGAVACPESLPSLGPTAPTQGVPP